MVEEVGEAADGTLVVRTHGVPAEAIAEARRRGLHVVDATCPFVAVAQRKAAELRQAGYQVVILGERDHPEVVGLQGFAGPDAVVVEDVAGLQPGLLSGRRIGVVVQTTQSRGHLASLGARSLPRDAFQRELAAAIADPLVPDSSWGDASIALPKPFVQNPRGSRGC